MMCKRYGDDIYNIFFINILVLTPLTDFLLHGPFSTQLEEMVLERATFSMVCYLFIFYQAFIFTFLFSELMNRLWFYCFLSHSVCPQ